MTGRIRALGARRIATVVTAVLVLAIGAGVLTLETGSDGPRHRVLAMFTDASPIIVGNIVKIDGVQVGTVSGLKVVHGEAQVTMDLTVAALPVHTDATAMIRPATLLGERYIDLDRGSPSAPVLADGGVLPASRTSQSTDLDQVLNTLDDPTGTALAALITTLGEGADTNGKNIAAAIKALAPAMTDAGKLARVLDEQNALLSSTLDSLTPVARALADDHGRTLNGVVTSADRLLATTSANQQALQQVLADLPQTLSTARATLAALAHAAASTAPTLQAIRPISDNLSQITDELHQFASSANPALASAEPVLKKAQTLLTNAQPVVAQLQAAGPAGLQDARSAQPLVSHLSANIDNVLNFLKYWALSTNGYDGLSHYFRGVVVATPAIATGSLPLTGGGSTKPTTPTKAAPNPLPITKTVTGLLGGLLAPTTGKDDGVTGLTKAQEKGGLLSLLGLGGP